MTTTSDVQPDITHTEPAIRRRSRLWQWVIGLLVVAGGAGLVWYYDFGKPAPIPQGGGFGRRGPEEKPPVRVVVAEQRNIGVALRALGTVTPINTVTVRSRLDGELVRVHFTEGQHVRKASSWPRSTPGPTKSPLPRPKVSEPRTWPGSTTPRADLETFKT